MVSKVRGQGPDIGLPFARVEDADLLCGRGRFGDDLPVRTGTLHAAILRSPHAHAECVGRYRGGAGHAGGRLRRDRRGCAALDAALLVAVKAAMEQWCLAVDRVRYVGEPVAVVVARDRASPPRTRSRAIAVDYRPLPAVVDPRGALRRSPLLHPALGGNIVSDRRFRYGDPEAAFAAAPHRIAITTAISAQRRHARSRVSWWSPNICRGEGTYEVTANFQGPLAMHPVMALALGVPANRLRLKTAAGFGRQLRRQARGLPVYRAAGAGRAQSRAAGQMGRNPDRTPDRRDLGDQPRDDAGRGGRG